MTIFSLSSLQLECDYLKSLTLSNVHVCRLTCLRLTSLEKYPSLKREREMSSYVHVVNKT